MSKNVIFIIIALAIGLLMGYVFFGGKVDEHDHEAAESKSTEMWTCSMHPQIMQPEPGNCPICGMELIPADNSSSQGNPNAFKMTETAMALSNIQTNKVEGEIGESNINRVELSGKIVTNEEENSVQVSYFSGRIEKLNVNVTGETVRVGQLIATVYSPELFAAQQELLTAANLKKSQPALYDAVRNKLKLWKLSDQQIDAIEASGKVQEKFPVYATVSGTVTEKLVAEGDQISKGQALFRVSNLSSLWADFDVYENQIEFFKKGQSLSISTNAYPNKQYSAKVSFIDPMLNSSSRTTTLRAELNNKEGELKPGMFVKAKVELPSPTSTETLTIPSTAILWTGKRSVVYVKTDPNHPQFEMREVTLGSKIGDNYIILNGLTVGEEIVTNGTFTVDAAAQLQGKPSMMNMKGNKKNEFETLTFTEVNETLKNKLYSAVEAYITLKNGLVDSNAEIAGKSANELSTAISKIIDDQINSEEERSFLNSKKEEIHTLANNISKTTNLDGMRTLFKPLSKDIIELVKAIGINHDIYEQYCPMADNNKGGYWLSKEKEIRNPYFGEAMLNCGEIKDTLH
ncbi:efflux RND transporter periplasmic adaptor subunit [Aegicerativicinus sediminis]|uniref:efflux RND transporter periplasmic adaptor subunit n=1 Tax=Aegicerativicinus sediminis TaxID=2893202 RepID=UPI001E4C8BC0|nr:efflux RND transporter periplasmic adaptor subunit [Aegicerativicinus sediminis]